MYEGEFRDGVHALTYMFGHPASFLVLGGHMKDMPQSLSLVHLPKDLGLGDEEPEVRLTHFTACTQLLVDCAPN